MEINLETPKKWSKDGCVRHKDFIVINGDVGKQ